MASKDRTLFAFFKKKEDGASSSSPAPAASSKPSASNKSLAQQGASPSSSTKPELPSDPPSSSHSGQPATKKRAPAVEIAASSDVEQEVAPASSHQDKKARLSPLLKGSAVSSDAPDPDEDEPVSSNRRRSSTKRPVIEDSASESERSGSPNPAKKPKTALSSKPPKSTTTSNNKKQKSKSKSKSNDDDFIVSDDASDSDDAPSDGAPEEEMDLDLGSVDWDAEETKASASSQHPSSSSAVKPKSKEPAPAAKKPPAPKKTASTGKVLNAFERKKEEQKAKRDAEDIFDFLKNPRDADKNPVGHPDYDPRTLYIADNQFKSLSPFEKQFWDIKRKHMDVVLFFQKGKFYELYENDALIGHQEFDLKLTDRVKMKMVGVPEAQFDDWAHKFLARGYKVGRVDQSETALGAEMRRGAETKPKATDKDKIVGRELKSVLTGATLVDGIVEDMSKHCVSIKESTSDNSITPMFGVCALDASTAKFDLAWFEDDVSRTRLGTLLRQIRPKEVITEKHNLSVSTQRVLKNILPLDCSMVSMKAGLEFFSGEEALENIKAVLVDPTSGALPPAIQSFEEKDETISALSGLVSYLKELNLDAELCMAGNFNIFDFHRRGETMQLDGQTLAHIEVLQNSLGETDGTLFKLMNRCVTPYGKRLFKLWLCQPLSEASAINARLDAVDDLNANPSLIESFLKATKGVPDLERVLSRIHAGNCKPSAFSKVLDGLSTISHCFAKFSKQTSTFNSTALKALVEAVPDLSEHISDVQAIYTEDEGMLVPNEGADEQFDNTNRAIEEAEDALQSQLKKYKKELKCPEMKFKDIGTKDIYQVEVPASTEVPDDWLHMSGTAKVKRYYTPRIKKLVQKLKELRETRTMLRNEFQGKLYQRFSQQYRVYLLVVKSAAEFDCLHSLAKTSTSLGEPSARPEIVDSEQAFVDFEQLRHPCLLSAEIDFIPNDVCLGGKKENLILLTGPNMAGKSTLLRMTAAAVIMAQVGCYVPATAARLAPFDKICTRMGANDFIFNATSTFKVEMDDCKKILSDATPRSLVILDELGRGTSTFDGVAIAFAVLHHLATHKSCVGFFSTHYNSLVRDFAYHSKIRACHMSTLDVEGSIVFSYTLKDGPTLKSYGPHVARLAGVPEGIVSRAMNVSEKFESQSLEKEASKTRHEVELPLPLQDDALFLARLSALPSRTSDKYQMLNTFRVIRDSFRSISPS